MIKGKYYVYEWFIVETGEIFYVGKGTKNRVTSMKDRNNYFKSVRKKYKCDYRILKYFDDEQQAYDYEKQRGIELKKIGQAKCNLELGGTKKYISPEVLEKIERTQFKKGLIPWSTGKKMSEEFCQKCRDRQLGKKQSEETKRKRSQSLKGHEVSQKTIDKLLERRCIKVCLIDSETNEIIKIYNSMSEVAREYNLSLSSISMKCKHHTKLNKKYYVEIFKQGNPESV